MLAAQQPDAERALPGMENDFLLRVWETTDGLLPTTIRSITQTRDGYVWLAANDGVVRFDGVRAVTFSGKNTPTLPLQFSVQRVHADPSGRLWCAIGGGRLFSMEQGEWREHGTSNGWPRIIVESMANSPAGKVFFSGATSLLEYSQGRFSRVATPDLPPRFRGPFKVLFDISGRMWLSSPSHVWRRDENQWQIIYTAPNLNSAVQGIATARGQGVWIATARQIRLHTAQAPKVTHERPMGFRSELVQLLEDSRGNLWAGGATSGLRVWTKDGRILTASEGVDGLQAQINSLFEDRERNILVGTVGAGFARFKPRPFGVRLAQLGGLSGTLVNTLFETEPGRILVGTEANGLRLLTENGAVVFGKYNDALISPRSRVTTLLKPRQGGVLAAVAGKGLFRIEGTNFTAYPSAGIVDELVHSLFEDDKGRLWVGHERGLSVSTNGSFARFPAGTRSTLTQVRGIVEGWSGTIWLIGKEGLMRVNGDKLEAVELPATVQKANLLSLRADADGALWIGVESRGLLRYKEGQAKLFTAGHGLPFVSIGAIVEEGNYLWLSGDKGLTRVSRKSLNAVAEGRATRLDLQFFNRADGLPSDAFRRGYQVAGFKAVDGRLWFASHKGVVFVRPNEIVTASYEPPAVIEEVRDELKLIPVTATNQDTIQIRADTRHMSIRCTSPSLGKPENVRFQYRLEGYDNQWRDGGGERVFHFYDLPAGAYRFQVRTFGTDGRLIDPPTSVRFFRPALFWQTAWFRGLVVAVVALLAGFAAWCTFFRRLRTQEETIRNRENRAQLEGELQQSQKMEAIGRLAGGIAHDFNNLLTVILGNAELLRMKLAGRADSQDALGSILQAGGRARDLVSQILTFSRHQLTAPVAADIAPALREACQLLRAGTPAMVEMKFEIPEFLPTILADSAQIQRVVLNLGTNAVQAVGPSGGRIRIKAEDFSADAKFVRANPKLAPGHYVRLTVEDNGAGMDAQTMNRIFDPFFTTKEIGKGTGLGLSVVHGIVEAHRGVITVRSQPGAGTTFEAYFPVTVTMAEAKTEMLQPLPKGHGENILLVDDDPAVLPITRMMLEKLGYQVDSSADSQAALKLFAESPQRFQLVITDYAMPGLDGVEFSKEVWKVRAQMPVILYSGYGGQFTPSDATRLGFTHMLEKPFQPRALAEAVAAALQNARRPAT